MRRRRRRSVRRQLRSDEPSLWMWVMSLVDLRKYDAGVVRAVNLPQVRESVEVLDVGEGGVVPVLGREGDGGGGREVGLVRRKVTRLGLYWRGLRTRRRQIGLHWRR